MDTIGEVHKLIYLIKGKVLGRIKCTSQLRYKWTHLPSSSLENENVSGKSNFIDEIGTPKKTQL
jgi:hypothetical protein